MWHQMEIRLVPNHSEKFSLQSKFGLNEHDFELITHTKHD